MRCSRCRVGRWEFSHRLLQIPPDLVVKSQVIDIAEINSSRIRRLNAVPMLCRNRTSRFAQLFTSEAHWSTTKSDGMCLLEGDHTSNRLKEKLRQNLFLTNRSTESGCQHDLYSTTSEFTGGIR